MDIPQNIIKAYLAVYNEGVEEHPDVAGQPDFARRADEILKRRKAARTPEAKAAKKAAAFFDKSVIKKKVEESSCGCDAEETPSVKKDKKNKVMDAREIPTKVNLIKTRLGLMGLRMSYEPEGELVEENKSGDESLRDWFSKSSGTNPKTGKEVKGWTQIGGPFAGAPCARQPGQTSTPKCGSSKMAANLSDKEEDKAFKRKNREDSNQPEKKNAASPTNVRTEEVELQEKEGKKDACYSKVKSRYSVWPSAYASGALVKCRKVGAANWGTKSEESIMEKEMTDKEVKAENKLKSKYDDSGMKASMIQQYGPEKGKQVYFATIRKKAMEEAFMDPEEELPGSRRKPIENVASHPNPKVRQKAVRGMKKQMEKEYGGKWKSSSKDPAVEEQLDYIEEKARGTRPKRTVHAYDVDETLFSHGKKGKPNVQVHVKDESGKRVKSLSNQEFNTHKLDKGHSYDFGEFRSAKTFSKTSTPNKKIIADLKRKQARGQNVHLITARSKFDKPSEFKGHLEKHGVKTPMSNIHYTGGMKGGDIGAKKVAVASAVAKKSGTKSMHMHDDAAKVHKAFEVEKKNKPTSAKIKTHMIKPNKSGEPTSRSYQATKEDFELIYDYILEQLILEGLAEDYDSAAELTEEFDDELLEDLMREAITAIGAPAPEPKRPEKKGPRKLKPIYGGGNRKLAPKKEYKAEDFTPYEFWMNIIETQQTEETEEVVEEEFEEIVEEGPTTSYDYWKNYIEENANFGNN
jgi:hypothetical protein